MRTIIRGGTIVTPHERLADHTLILEGDKITAIDAGEIRPGTDDRLVDAHGCWVTPGLIDLHIHGSGGFGTMQASTESLHGMSRFLAQHGTTSLLPTTVSTDRQSILDVLNAVSKLPQPSGGAHIPGVHIEGPFLNPENTGAQPPEGIRAPDLNELRGWIKSGQAKLITIAPELEGTSDLIQEALEGGIEIALGHTSASYEIFSAAIDMGARQATHTFNSMLGLHHRKPGPIGAILTDDRIYAQVIADGVHLHPAVVKLLIKAKGPKRIILISDAISAAGLSDGEYDLGGHKVFVKEGVARIRAGNLAGSTLTLDQALRNVIQFTGLTFPEALPMATSVPAEAMGWEQKGKLEVGADADVVLFDEDLNVVKTIVGGRCVFEAANQTQA